MGVNTDRRFLCYSNIFCVFYHNFLSCRKVFCLHMCLCLSSDCGGQKRVSHCLEQCDGCEVLCECWKPNPGPLQAQSVLLAQL